ncbi:ABC transporter ATP-binding protein [Jannaschia sp. LMIT008]|uniref:ABC transporter ATP-binding protein n=1 Tax=Jannaschia maritima TaxID=3032585 RepID=UPI002811D250|nr:ABC transporter ATP-binding protein [Jannaschia sp. LMIT008]
MASIEFRGVSKSYGGTQALRDVSFRIEDNEFFCLFGPPLCGKSTILRLILGLEDPDAGEVLIADRPAAGIGPAERDIAMVFQNLALFPHMTARDNVAFPLVERGRPKAEIAAKVADAAEKLHMTHILHKAPGQLSGGERQRVAIARALVRDPVAFLMDDPISALDARLREETRVELKRIQREVGHTLVYVTHDQEEAMSVADRMVILREGRVEQVGTPVEIYDDPSNAYVAGILGAPEINVMPLGRGRTADGLIAVPDAPEGAASIGIRPENLRLTEGDGARITDVEPLGGFTVVTLSAPDGPDLRALLRGQPDLSPGARVGVEDGTARMFFDRDGRRLRMPAAVPA